jgi:hypothetical protein
MAVSRASYSVLCEHLKRLPLSNQNAGTIKEIEGESEWWNALEWDDHETKSSLLPYFRPSLGNLMVQRRTRLIVLEN